jgi:hypothetical protein
MIEHAEPDLESEITAAKHILKLNIPPEKVADLPHVLGPEGIGTFVIPETLNSGQIAYMQEEIFDPFSVPWRDNHNVFVNKRGLKIIENHDVFALKAKAGDQRWLNRVPRMQALAETIGAVIRSQATHFPALESWSIDEISLHRYDNSEVGLSRHRDNLRYIGMIAVLTLEGESDFITWDEDGNEHIVVVKEGDLVLNRATDLYPASLRDGQKVNLCPDHAVVNVRTPHRTSFILRDNAKPEYAYNGFEYENWVGIPEHKKAQV